MRSSALLLLVGVNRPFCFLAGHKADAVLYMLVPSPLFKTLMQSVVKFHLIAFLRESVLLLSATIQTLISQSMDAIRQAVEGKIVSI